MTNTCCPNCLMMQERAELAEATLSRAIVSYLRLRRLVSRLLRREMDLG